MPRGKSCYTRQRVGGQVATWRTIPTGGQLKNGRNAESGWHQRGRRRVLRVYSASKPEGVQARLVQRCKYREHSRVYHDIREKTFHDVFAFCCTTAPFILPLLYANVIRSPLDNLHVYISCLLYYNTVSIC